MSKKTGSCLWTSVPQISPTPCDRYKHAICAYNGNVYLFGGRGKHSLKDFWKYNVVCNKWIELDCEDDNAPDELEEHSMVPHQGVLYIFGGLRDSAYSDTKTPFWLFDIAKEHWIYREEQSPLSQNVPPANRKGHSAVVLRSSMLIYGGYIDMRGASQELWRFDMDSRLWSLLNSTQMGPGSRHSHSAIVHQDYMYLYGGLQGLKEQRDLWRWCWDSHAWTCIRTFSGPSKLMGHSAVVYKDSMLLFGGGETQTAPTNCLWSLDLTTLTWEMLSSLQGSTAPCRIHHRCVGLGQKFQPRLPNYSSKELSMSKSKDSTFRPFKNKCFPSSPKQPEENIELQNLHVDLKSKTYGNCLTFENHVAQKNRDSEHSENETEDTMEVPMPDFLLILGGKPLKDQAAISMWQMTLGDS
ncbi:actin-fragmin kinase-like isoform X1 [Clarias magur]|uniref:Actin-fragmin kinase-like isoform X1 n=1 Tax=Clarias magur TaxID=1594786 RepID=A0A8J4U409_CLAMG|nr:actin-fragmin kinase-like isoform X1 [Clarias magur]